MLQPIPTLIFQVKKILVFGLTKAKYKQIDGSFEIP